MSTIKVDECLTRATLVVILLTFSRTLFGFQTIYRVVIVFGVSTNLFGVEDRSRYLRNQNTAGV